MNWAAVVFVATLLLAACDAEPSSRATVSATGARVEPFIAVPPGSAPRGTRNYLRQTAGPGPPITQELLVRGRDHYNVFCSPCHGLAGYGDGTVVQRGFPQPPSFHTEQQRSRTRPQIVAVISNGIGRMYPFAESIPPQDRWAIASYVKALQLSQAAPLHLLPDELRMQVDR